MEFTRNIIDANPYPMYIKDVQGKLVFANEAYATLYGQSAAALLAKGKPDFDFTSERDLEVIQSGSEANFDEFYRIRQSHDGVWFHTIKTTIKTPDGNSYLLSVSTELSDLKTDGNNTETAHRIKEDFMLNASSEFRHSIQDIILVLKKNAPDTVPELASATDKLQLVSDLVADFGGFMAGKKTLGAVVFDVYQLVKATVEAVASTAAAQGNQFEFIEPGAGSPPVEGDPGQLGRVLGYLLKELAKLVQQCRITLTASAIAGQQETVVVTLFAAVVKTASTDSNFLKLLESMNHTGSSHNHLCGEASAVLAMCKSLLELQGGEFHIHTLHDAEIRIHINLPFRLNLKTAIPDQNDAAAARDSLRGLRILLAEDNHINRLLATTHLQSWGIKVDIACDGEEALAKTVKQRYNLILMDIEMPKANGIETTSRIRQSANQNHSTPIIAFTANEIKYDFDKYLALGFTDCLLKPYHETMLYEVIRKNACLVAFAPEPAAPPHSAEAPGLYDFSGLGDLANNPLFVRKMQQLFIDTVPKQLRELKQAIQQKDWGTVAQSAHRLKSTYGNINVQVPAEAMKEIEHIAKTRTNFSRINDLMAQASNVTAKVVTEFSNELGTQHST